MKCVICSNRMQEINTSYNSRWGDYTLTIQGIKAYKCDECDELVFNSEVAKMIQSITAGFSEKEGDKPDFLNVEETAELLRVSNQTIYNMIKDGRLVATKVGREWRFSKEKVISLIDNGNEEISLAAQKGTQLTQNESELIQKHVNRLKNKSEEKRK